jgi:hypothetical protein
LAYYEVFVVEEAIIEINMVWPLKKDEQYFGW